MMRIATLLVLTYAIVALVSAVVLTVFRTPSCETTYPPPPDPAASEAVGPSTVCK